MVLLEDVTKIEKPSRDPICYIPSLDHGAVKQSLHPSPDRQSTENLKAVTKGKVGHIIT